MTEILVYRCKRCTTTFHDGYFLPGERLHPCNDKGEFGIAELIGYDND